VILAPASLRKGGVVAINAIHLDRIPEFDYDRLLCGERQLRSVANMTRSGARDFLEITSSIGLRPEGTAFPWIMPTKHFVQSKRIGSTALQFWFL